MPKSPRRWSKLSGSSKHRINRLIIMGWQPGIAPRGLLGKKRKGTNYRAVTEIFT